MALDIKHMKWWGWGDPEKEFDVSNKPGLWPYIEKHIGGSKDLSTPPVDLDSIALSPAHINQAFLSDIQSLLGAAQIKADKYERLVHAYGKSFRDVWRIRHGIVTQAPDMVIYPQNEAQVVAIIRAAAKHGVSVVPFGGGSNIVGCVEVKDQQQRMCISLDMKHMSQVLELDRQSRVARIQAGVLGPLLEQQLNQQGYTLGHFPDSFEYSTLGGWVATRSAGMQSDRYGKIEDMVLSLRMVTPSGTIVTRTVPKCSNGIDVNHLCIGSEGILGVITEVSVMVHLLPQEQDYFGYLFPNFTSGIDAIYECVQRNCLPVVTRLSDPEKTALSFSCKSRGTTGKEILSKIMSTYLRRVKRFDFSQVCMMITSLEGDKPSFKVQKQLVNRIFRKHGAVCLGVSPGRAFAKAKYDFPYLRDYVMDRNIMADVSETATVWSNLQHLYVSTKADILQAMRETGVKPWVCCHISHNYHSGASLYFTFACQQQSGKALEQYLHIKKAAETAFIKYGGTLSHHHAVGYEHLPWVAEDISATGVKAIKGLKHSLDPAGIMNPGKLIPSEKPFNNWGLSTCYQDEPVSSPAALQD